MPGRSRSLKVGRSIAADSDDGPRSAAGLSPRAPGPRAVPTSVRSSRSSAGGLGASPHRTSGGGRVASRHRGSRRPSAVARAGRSPARTSRPGASPASDGATLAAVTTSRSPSASRKVPGHGWKARTWRSSSDADRVGVEAPVLPAQRPGQGDALARAAATREVAADPRSDRTARSSVAADGTARCRSKLGCGLVPGQRDLLDSDDRTRVQAGVHPHQGDAGSRVTLEDGRRDRRRATMAGQQRRVQVQRTEREVEERRRHDLAVVGEDDQGGLEREHVGDGLRRPGAGPVSAAVRCRPPRRVTRGVGARGPPVSGVR